MSEPLITPTRNAYASKTMLLDVQTVGLDMLVNTFMRAPGEAAGTFAPERAIDELAEALNMDPITQSRHATLDKYPARRLPHSERKIVVCICQTGIHSFGNSLAPRYAKLLHDCIFVHTWPGGRTAGLDGNIL